MGREGNPKFNVAKGRASHALELVAGVHISARRRSLFSPARTCNGVEDERVHDERERERSWIDIDAGLVVKPYGHRRRGRRRRRIDDEIQTLFGVYSRDIFV